MRRKLRILLSLMCLILFCITPVHGEERDDDSESIDVTLTYTLEGVVFHKLQVHVRGPGIVKDGDAVIREGTNTYELREEAEKTLEIEADEGSHLSSVDINGQKSYDSSQKSITLKGLKEDAEVSILFENDQEEDNSSDDITDNQDTPDGSETDSDNLNKDGIGTGDNTAIELYVCVMLIAIVLMMYVKRKKKTTDMSEGEK